MSESEQEIISIVSSIFEVKSINQNLDAFQFEIGQGGLKEKFVKLAQTLNSKNLIARLERFEGRMLVLVGRLPPKRSSRAWIPRVLFAITIAMVMIDGYFRTTFANSITFIGDPMSIAILYTASLIGILGIHELGHMMAGKCHKLKTSWPYFIPGIPVVGIPTFGALITARSPMTNRDTLFDVGISGPIAGLIVAILVSVYGVYLSPLVPADEVQPLFSKSDIVQVHPSILMNVIVTLAGKDVPGMQMIMSPVLYAAWLGFLITFLNLLPAWQLDGGHMARATLGRKWHKITTYAGIAILVALGYWFMALFILSFGMRNPDARPLDDVSPLSRKRKIIFILVMILAVFIAPHPGMTMH